MKTAALTQQVTDAQLRRYATLVYDRTGIRISPQKKTLLSNRLRRRLRATGIENYDAYARHVEGLANSDPEWDAFLQEITTHETYLFRDVTHWNWFASTYLPEIKKEADQGKRPKSLRIWSAACSTGDEAYTIASCIADKLPDDGWKISIVGTDIGVGAVEQARNPAFNQRAMHNVSESYRRRFFKQLTEHCWAPKPPLTEWTSFSQHNLMEPIRQMPFDLIFLKNVLIYFDADSKKVAFSNVDRALKKGGLLATGPAEGITDLLGSYERMQPWLHRKP